jgi:hypothetical protein
MKCAVPRSGLSSSGKSLTGEVADVAVTGGADITVDVTVTEDEN